MCIQMAEGKKLLEKELVQRLPPEDVRTATFVKQAMANSKVWGADVDITNQPP